MLLLYLYVLVVFLQQLKKKKEKKKRLFWLSSRKEKKKAIFRSCYFTLLQDFFSLKTSMLHGMLTYWCFCKRDVHKCILHCHNDSLGMLFFFLSKLFKYARSIPPSLAVAQSSSGFFFFFFDEKSLLGTFEKNNKISYF